MRRAFSHGVGDALVTEAGVVGVELTPSETRMSAE
jgi:hypothetical protein